MPLQPYDFTVENRPGKENPADYISRHPLKSENTFRHFKVAEEYLNFIVCSSKPKALSVEQITEASNKDPIIQEVVSRMLKGEWKSTPKDIRVQPYFRIRDKLTIAPTECHTARPSVRCGSISA